MNRLKTMLAVLLLACAQTSRTAETVTLEPNYSQRMVSLTTSGVTSANFDIGGFGAYGYAILGKPSTFNGVDGTVNTAPSVVSSTWSNVVLFDWAFYSLSTGTVKIAQTVKTPSAFAVNPASFPNPRPTGFISVPQISTSSTIVLPPSLISQFQPRARVTNPVFILSSLNPAATYTITVTYGIPK